MLASVKLLFVRLRQTLDVIFTFFFELLLFVFTIKDYLLLLCHPFDVEDLLALHFKVIAGMPILLTLGVFLLKEVTDVLCELVDFF